MGVEGGLLHGGGVTLLGAQAVGVLAAIAFVFPVSLLMFFIISKTIGLRVGEETEAIGLDLTYHGIESYPEFAGVGACTASASLSTPALRASSRRRFPVRWRLAAEPMLYPVHGGNQCPNFQSAIVTTPTTTPAQRMRRVCWPASTFRPTASMGG
ncbi:MAG: hypothetical protein R2844_20865 [Caldilineales bacterium]